MGDKSKIAWTDATWNPVTGCSKISAGCTHCYAERTDKRLRGAAGQAWREWSASNAEYNVRLHPERFDQPLRWKKPRMIFVNSMSDLFHPQVSDWVIYRLFEVMRDAPHHTFQILTKRPERARKFFERNWALTQTPGISFGGGFIGLPLPNVWIGVSVEHQQVVERRLQSLMWIPAAVRFVSCEPLLSAVELMPYLDGSWADPVSKFNLDWVIAGGESGPNARPMRPYWARSLRDDCLKSQVPFFFKQWGRWMPMPGEPDRLIASPQNEHDIPLLDGRAWTEFPRLQPIA